MECTFWPSNNQLHLTTIISRVTISRPSASSGHGKWSFDCHVCIAAGDQHSTLQQTNASAKALAVEDQSRPNASIIYHSLSTSPSPHPSKHQNLFKRREETHNCRQNNKDICNVLGCSIRTIPTYYSYKLCISQSLTIYQLGHNQPFIFPSVSLASSV